jgi:hypothetical protein
MKPVATSSPQAKTPVVACCQPSWVLLPPYFNLLTGGSMKTYHVTLAFTEYEYYRVEANSEKEAKEIVYKGETEQYNWDKTYESIEVEVCS